MPADCNRQAEMLPVGVCERVSVMPQPTHSLILQVLYGFTRVLGPSAAALLALAACATAPAAWTHPTKPAAEFDRDRYDCELTAAEHLRNLDEQRNRRKNLFDLVAGSNLDAERDRCLRMKHGWAPIVAPRVGAVDALMQ